jgi:AcrR family transcriptional regulator
VRSASYARRVADTAAAPSETRAGRRERATADTRSRILDAARDCLVADGFANLSTRRVADLAEVPLSQIHYHFGSKQRLVLALLEAENDRLLARQRTMFGGPEPLWQQWDRACDYLDEDVESGYVRVLHEMIAAGWSDAEVAERVRHYMTGWFTLLTEVAAREGHRLGGLGPFTPAEIGTLMGIPFTGAESMILLGFEQSALPARSALRRIGAVIRTIEERAS